MKNYVVLYLIKVYTIVDYVEINIMPYVFADFVVTNVMADFVLTNVVTDYILKNILEIY